MMIEDVDRLNRRANLNLDDTFCSEDIKELCDFIYSLRDKNALLQRKIDDTTPVSVGRDFLVGPR
jgi:hypothetical protein